MADLFLLQILSKRRNIVMSLIGAAFCAVLYEWISIKILGTFGILYIAFHLSDLTTKFLYNSLPKQLIENTNDKAVVITGCDSGFGNALAIKLDGIGFKVYAGCLDVRGEGPQELKTKCSKRLSLIPLDVTKSDQVSAATHLVASTLEDRKLWAVVNNAGVACSSEIEWCPINIFENMLEVNTLGTVRVTKAFLPLLRESQGRVVCVASMAGRVTVPGFTPYSMSKFAVVAFADGLRREMQKWGISVHCIEPSLYSTNISVVEPLYKSLKNYWDQCPDDVQSSYGNEYLEHFKESLSAHMKRAKPAGKITEVVDDMLDAVAGAEPLLRYVPAMDVQFRSRVLISMPIEMQDHVLNQYSPKIPPAAVVAKRSMLPPLKSPYSGQKRPPLQRHMSMPAREKNLPETLQEQEENAEPASAFQFS
ncbi:hypothetical protein DAPPUDRAFT_200252 [Daphnia pulex]|uniref:Estradiol 17-beta-dehydrogenase 2 n=1 Tax=Daphnia pulex TaxID=6669 RepID=E9H296_DAPPU|nr:hypothetical protein DAPPUDRAFT_200252 [Daphnia pulex]|eukprot:EFX74132.1 hypothetical protein DAPPUDRAFT_200252 [Daphnia pulex]